MSFFTNNGTSTKLSPLMRVLHIVYWVIFAIALVIVLAFIAFKIFVDKPVIENPEIIVPPTSVVTPPPATDEPVIEDPVNTPEPLVLHRKEGVYTCLLAGTDNGNANADTIMLGVFDTKAKTASLISIPRDTLVTMDGKEYKINAVYAYYGLEGVCEAVSDTLCVPVDYFVAVDLAAFIHIVDWIGGVWFTVPQDMDYEDPTQDLYIHIKEGYQLLNGEDALKVMRFRSGYANQDLGRVQTQRNLLVAMVKQSITLSNVTKVGQLIRELSNYVETNMTINVMAGFAEEAIGMDLSTALQSKTLPGEWIYPYLELRNDEVLELVNNLGIYEEEVPPEALHIYHKEHNEE